jgi:hypothetical protein
MQATSQVVAGSGLCIPIPQGNGRLQGFAQQPLGFRQVTHLLKHDSSANPAQQLGMGIAHLSGELTRSTIRVL